jgi:hypothetical protein
VAHWIVHTNAALQRTINSTSNYKNTSPHRTPSPPRIIYSMTLQRACVIMQRSIRIFLHVNRRNQYMLIRLMKAVYASADSPLFALRRKAEKKVSDVNVVQPFLYGVPLARHSPPYAFSSLQRRHSRAQLSLVNWTTRTLQVPHLCSLIATLFDDLPQLHPALQYNCTPHSNTTRPSNPCIEQDE